MHSRDFSHESVFKHYKDFLTEKNSTLNIQSDNVTLDLSGLDSTELSSNDAKQLFNMPNHSHVTTRLSINKLYKKYINQTSEKTPPTQNLSEDDIKYLIEKAQYIHLD